MKISNRVIKGIFAIIACSIAIAAFFWIFGNSLFVGTNSNIMTIIQESFLMAAIALGATFLLILGSMYKFSTTMGKVWFFLGIGMASWFIGEFLYTYISIMGGTPSPSIADLFYIIAYPILIFGLLIQIRLLKIKLSTKEMSAVAVASILADIIIFFLTLYPLIILPSDDTMTEFINTLYPVLDIFLLSCVFIVFAKLRKGRINSAWMLILSGLIVLTVADILYQIYANVNGLLFYSYDLAFLISYLLIFAGSLKIINIMSASFTETTTKE